MELFLLFLYALSVLAIYLSIERNDSDFDGEDPGEFNMVDFM